MFLNAAYECVPRVVCLAEGDAILPVYVPKRERLALIIVVLVGTLAEDSSARRAGAGLLCDRKIRVNGVKPNLHTRIFWRSFTRFAAWQRLQRNEVKTAIFTVLYHAREPHIDVDHETLLRYNKKQEKSKHRNAPIRASTKFTESHKNDVKSRKFRNYVLLVLFSRNILRERTTTAIDTIIIFASRATLR